MDTKELLEDNRRRRDAQGKLQRQLDDGVVEFRIPPKEYSLLRRVFPELFSLDPAERAWAWEAFKDTPLGEQYMVVRTPSQVRRSHKNRVIVR